MAVARGRRCQNDNRFDYHAGGGSVASSTDGERERYIEWLKARGASAADLAAHRVYAGKILAVSDGEPVQPADVDAAVEEERAAGAAEKRLGNLRRVGDFLLQFQRESPPPAPDAPRLDTAAFRPPPPEIATADIQLAERPKRVTAPPRAVAPRPVEVTPSRAGRVVVLVACLGLAVAVSLWLAATS